MGQRMHALRTRRRLERPQRRPVPLDGVPREVAAQGDVDCPPGVPTVSYPGAEIAYGGPLLVASAFEPKLRAFERVVVQVAKERYGRAPERVLHFGVRACRRIRGASGRMSEHALGNALDLAGFRFGRASDPPPSHLPAPLLRSFTITVIRHFQPTSAHAIDHLHSHFLHELIARVRARRIFRGIVGPGREGHADHLHLDYAPWRYALF